MVTPSSRTGRLSSTDGSSGIQRGCPLATAIALFLYEGRGVHGVSEFTASPGVVRLKLTPWEGPQVHTCAVFGEDRLISLDAYPDDRCTLDLPWDVIGFDSDDLGGGRWRFVLHWDAIEWCFESAWPVISRAASERGRDDAGP